jgi:hypothetical protein
LQSSCACPHVHRFHPWFGFDTNDEKARKYDIENIQPKLGSLSISTPAIGTAGPVKSETGQYIQTYSPEVTGNLMSPSTISFSSLPLSITGLLAAHLEDEALRAARFRLTVLLAAYSPLLYLLMSLVRCVLSIITAISAYRFGMFFLLILSAG